MAIERRALREQVREELLERMRSGAVSPGEGINEVTLAAELGVSRTPLREALIALESEGQIESQSGRGFRFVPMRAREFEELGPIMASLEGLALELSPVQDLKEIGGRLRRMAEEFDADLAEHSTIMTRDDEWHEVLLSSCPNRRLLQLVAGVRQAFHRYESLLVPDSVMVARVAAEHRVIAERLEDGDVEGARTALTENWVNGTRRILERASGPYFTE
jgi:DNA-binding GntR family transcriptional regulator